MYRYSVDDAVTYTAQDIVLFRESPFASWMERLTLDNPNHGIPPDIGSEPPHDGIECQDEMAYTLRAENKDVCVVEWQADEPDRRSATLAAMRDGVDFIVNGQLALGPLSGAANLLVRTSGYSDFGDFLYIPCDTQSGNRPHVAFRLCFLADLLQSLQGQLAPQMLIVRDGGDLVPLQTDSHIYHFRAVQQRFLEAMRDFHEHHMPDPAESSHFGRWSDCANEVLRQQLLRTEDQALEDEFEEDTQTRRASQLTVARGAESPYDLDDIGPGFGDEMPGAIASLAVADADADTLPPPAPAAASISATPTATTTSSLTLVEQARLLQPAPEPGPGEADSVTVAQETSMATAAVTPGAPQHNRRASDSALQNLEFIGSGGRRSDKTDEGVNAKEKIPPIDETAPAPSLRAPRRTTAPKTWAGSVESWPPGPMPRDDMSHTAPAGRQARGPLSADISRPLVPQLQVDSVMDLDSGCTPPPPQLATASAELPMEADREATQPQLDSGLEEEANLGVTPPPEERFYSDLDAAEEEPSPSGFSSSLITNDGPDH